MLRLIRNSTLQNDMINNKNQLVYYQTNEKKQVIINSYVCHYDGSVELISQELLRDIYFYAFSQKIAPVFNKALNNLMNIRNHLLLQLDLECGIITEKYFDKEEPKYLKEIECNSLDKLFEEIKILYRFTNLKLDSIEVSDLLNCSIEDAEKGIKHYINEA